MPHTFAIVHISQSAFDEIRAALIKAEYMHTFKITAHGKAIIDMHGLAVAITPPNSVETVPEIEEGYIHSTQPTVFDRNVKP